MVTVSSETRRAIFVEDKGGFSTAVSFSPTVSFGDAPAVCSVLARLAGGSAVVVVGAEATVDGSALVSLTAVFSPVVGLGCV